jgi:hypothetical protein
MSINKNFVVRHGFEVSTDLILANADTRKVGIGTTNPQYKLDVAGGIGATDAYVSGIGTFANELNVGLDGTVLTVLGIGNYLNVTGISTLGTVRISSGIITATSGIVTYYGDGQYLDLTLIHPLVLVLELLVDLLVMVLLSWTLRVQEFLQHNITQTLVLQPSSLRVVEEVVELLVLEQHHYLLVNGDLFFSADYGRTLYLL